jgi:hypothetical protein
MAHLVLLDTQADPSAKPKEPFFATAPIKNRILTNYYMTSK